MSTRLPERSATSASVPRPRASGGAGAFPRASRGTVLWLGVTEGGDLLTRLAGAVQERTALLGYESDDRPYRPHVTLARCRSPQNLRSVIASFGDEPVGPSWSVDAVTVFESETRSDGARYLERGVDRATGLSARAPDRNAPRSSARRR